MSGQCVGILSLPIRFFFACMLGYAANSLFTVLIHQVYRSAILVSPSFLLRSVLLSTVCVIQGRGTLPVSQATPKFPTYTCLASQTLSTPTDPRWGFGLGCETNPLTSWYSCQMSKAKLRTVAEQVSGFHLYLCTDHHTTQPNHYLQRICTTHACKTTL